MNEEKTLLVILNTRTAVSKLYKLIKEENPDFIIRGLSNNMVPAHREIIINETKELMKKGEKILLISTALIEAGVDISFSGVIRSLTGLDTIIQAAGRCNRHGEKDVGDVWVINLDKDFEDITRLEDIKIAKEVTETILNDFIQYPQNYDNDIASEKTLKKYFINFLKESVNKTKYPYQYGGETHQLYDLLSCNEEGNKNYKSKNNKCPKSKINQAFLTAGREYKPIEDSQVQLLVDWGEGSDIIVRLNSDSKNFEEKKKLLDKLSLYTVQTYKYVYDKLKEDGGIYNITFFDKEIPILRKEYYSDIGIIVEDKKELDFMCL